MAARKHDISQSTTQLFLDLYDITNDLIILGDGAASLVLTVSAMNFGLLSEGEQDATIYAYAALLNSLSFPIEIVIRSQPKDVTSYLKKVQDMEESATNPTYRQKIREYRNFVESLVQDQNVLDKKFYIVIPLSAVEMGLTTQSIVPGTKNKPLSSFEKNYIIEKAKTNLIPRRDHLIDQLARIGLYSRQLTTQELIQMLYSSYNPESFEGQKVTDTSNYTTPLVQAKIQGDFMIDQTVMPTAATQPGVTTPAPSAPVQPSSAAMNPMGSEPSTPAAPAAPAAPSVTSEPIPMPSSTPSASSPALTGAPGVAAPTTPPAPTAPATPATPEPIAMPGTPDFNKTDLGFTTPPAQPSMGAPTPAAPAAPSVTPVAAEMSSNTIAESPLVSTPTTPVESPMSSTPSSAGSASTADPQDLINQTLNQGGIDSSVPNVGAMPSMTPPTES